MINISKELAHAVWDYLEEHKYKDVAHILNPYREAVLPQFQQVAEESAVVEGEVVE